MSSDSARAVHLAGPAKGAALDIPAEPWLVGSVFLARFARLGPLRGWTQRVQSSRSEPRSGPPARDGVHALTPLSWLLAWECRRVLTSPVVSAIFVVLLLTSVSGALNASRLHRDQQADIARMADAEAAWYRDIDVRAARYSQPSSASVPYWQDPTGASGFSRYFLRRFAAKPHLPLSALAVGQSDLQPYAIPIRLETLFGGDRVYDFEPPRALATGIFDLGFVLVFVLPFCVGVVVAVVAGVERDHGILPLVAAQPISPRRWWLLRVTALALVLVPGTIACVVLALAAAGAPIAQAWRETLAACALVSAHVLFWLVLAARCIARGSGAVATLSIVAAVWLLATVAVPLAGTVTLRVVKPPPSPVADVDERRQVTDVVQADVTRIIRARLAAHLGSVASTIDPASLDYATRLVLLTPVTERRLAHQEERHRAYARAADVAATIVRGLSPQVAFQAALTDLAGTSVARHRAFLDQVRDFQLALRAFMYPRVLDPLVRPARRSCDECPGRLTFTDYDAIPRFAMREAPAVYRASAIATAMWLMVLAFGLVVVGVVRGARWSLGS
jgi:ABC-2 type transport system permease protein